MRASLASTGRENRFDSVFKCAGETPTASAMPLSITAPFGKNSSDTPLAIDSNPTDITDFKSKNCLFSRNCPDQCICYELTCHCAIYTNHSSISYPGCGVIGIHHPRRRIDIENQATMRQIHLRQTEFVHLRSRKTDGMMNGPE
jgi:hypothetical protein